jgi:hypothetical protein
MARKVNECDRCRHLRENADPGVVGWPRFFCEKRRYRYPLDEERHVRLLNDAAYRARSKKCFESLTDEPPDLKV